MIRDAHPAEAAAIAAVKDDDDWDHTLYPVYLNGHVSLLEKESIESSCGFYESHQMFEVARFFCNCGSKSLPPCPVHSFSQWRSCFAAALKECETDVFGLIFIMEGRICSQMNLMCSYLHGESCLRVEAKVSHPGEEEFAAIEMRCDRVEIVIDAHFVTFNEDLLTAAIWVGEASDLLAEILEWVVLSELRGKIPFRKIPDVYAKETMVQCMYSAAFKVSNLRNDKNLRLTERATMNYSGSSILREINGRSLEKIFSEP